LLLLAAFSRHEQALDWTRQQAAQAWGPLIAASDVFAFDQTDYYAPTMGAGLKKVLLAFENLIDPQSGGHQAPDEPLGGRVSPDACLAGATAFEPGSGIPDRSETGSGDDQGSQSPPVLGPGHLSPK
jgi:hypothetical protein